MDLDWADEQCQALVKRSHAAAQAMITVTSSGRNEHRAAALASLNEQVSLVKQIARQIAPEHLSLFDAVHDIRDWAQVAGAVRGEILARRDYADKLGPQGPVLAAQSLHPKVWKVASAYWDSGMYDDAIESAAKIVLTEARAKLDRRDLDESAVGDAFSKESPRPGVPRFRFCHVDPEDTRTWDSVHMGALHYAKGCFMALRNPRAHLLLASEENVALEQLAAFSVLARWIDECEVKRAE